MSYKKLNQRSANFERLDERVVFSNTYFVDPVYGDDNADGLSPASAVRTLERYVSQYESLKPERHVDLGPGDTLVLMPGDHHFAYRYGEGQWQGLFLRGVHGTASQPVTIRGMDGARIDNRAPDGTEMSSIYVLQSSHIVIENLDVSSYGSAITVADASDVVVRNNYIHDVNGIAANNLSGVYLVGVRNVVVEDNLLTDNYDRSRLGNPNNRHIVIFGGIDVKVLGNTMRNSDPNAGMAVDYKHLGGVPADEVGDYEVAYNTIINAAGTAIGTSAPNSYIHHNLLIDSGSIRVADLGGTNQLANERIEFNTIVNTLDRSDGGGLSYYPTEYAGYPLGDLYWSHNLVVDNRKYDHSEKSTLFVDRYGSDEYYRRVFDGNLFHADGNVYQTQDDARYDLYGANGGRYGELGSYLSFAQWQAAGFDRTGSSSSIAVDGNFKITSAMGDTAGLYAGKNPRLTLLLDRLDIDETGAGATTKLRVVRSGSNAESLMVTLNVSVSNEIKLSQHVTIPAGQDFVEVTIEGIADRTLDPTQAIQIEAAADGFQDVATWVRLHDSAPTDVPNAPMDPSDPIEVDLAPGVFQVPGSAGESVRFQADVTFRGGAYNNAMGVAYVDDAMGRVNGLLPSDPGWIQALMGRCQHTTVLQSGVTTGDVGQTQLQGGRYFVFFLVQDSSLEHWQLSNPANDLNQNPKLFTSIEASNPDRFDHLHESLSADAIDLAWEDLDFGGDKNFTDLVIESIFDLSCLPTSPGVTPVMPPDDGSLIVCVTTVDGCECRPVTPGDGGDDQGDEETTLPPDDSNDTGSEPITLPKQWNNPESRSDVNGDGYVSPLDLLLVINALNRYDQLVLSDFPTDDTRELGMVDTNDDRTLDKQDAFIVFVDLLDQLLSSSPADGQLRLHTRPENS